MGIIDNVIAQFLSRKFGGDQFEVVRNEWTSNGELLLGNGRVSLSFSLDPRGDVVLFYVALAGNEGKPGKEYLIETVLEFLDQEIDDAGLRRESPESQVEFYLSAIQGPIEEFLCGDTGRFALLHEYSRGYDAGYTDAMSE